MTPQEAILWEHLRAHRLLGIKFKRQVIIGTYIVDFCSTQKKVIIELDGDKHRGGSSYAYDKERDLFLASEGYRILRFWNSEVEKGIEDVLEIIRGVIVSTSPPAPPRVRGGVT